MGTQVMSIKALKDNNISRKDDIICFCYFSLSLFIGYLPLDDIKNDTNKNKGKIFYKKFELLLKYNLPLIIESLPFVKK